MKNKKISKNIKKDTYKQLTLEEAYKEYLSQQAKAARKRRKQNKSF